jgi:hypothetical protein
MKSFKRLKPLIAVAIASAVTITASAQDGRDAFRLSYLQPQGTARSIGIGGALGSVGGDFSTLAVNPAGIGIYRRSEFTVSPSLMFTNTSSSFAGNNSDDNSGSHFAISNLGLALTNVDDAKGNGGWSPISFGIGLTRLADFTRNYAYEGRNTTSSGSFIFEYDANNLGLSNSEQPTTPGDLGYDARLIDPVTDSTGETIGYLSVVNPTATSPISQSNIIRERGGISELGLSLGGAYQEKLLIGGTLGFPIVRYERNKTYEERDLSGNDKNNFDYYRYSEDLKTTGAGINLKLGMIYKAADNFRFGIALHTPTYFSLTDVTNRSLIANTEGNVGTRSATAMENQYDYNILTPWRGIASATALFGQYGFFTLDYEFVDYSSSRVTFGDSRDEKAYQSFINNSIRSTYKAASNVRAGLEIRLDNIMLRGGFGYYGNPYKSKNQLTGVAATPNGERIAISGGLGFRFANAFVDLGFVHSQYMNAEQPYQLPDEAPYIGLVVPSAELKTGTNNAVLTVGFKF